MSTELATTSQQAISVEKISVYLDSMGLASKLTPQEKTQFIEIAQAFGLNPFIREIYATKYGEGQYAKFSIIVGYEVYLKRAERSGQLAGWSATTTGSVEGGDLRGIVTIYRKDWANPLIHEVYYAEYVQTTYDKDKKEHRPNKMWSEKPFTMIKKVAIAQGFRMAFSVDLGGIPYTSDEMPTIQEQAVQVTAQQAADKPVIAHQTKEELANAMKQIQNWQNEVDFIPAVAEKWTEHGAKLGKLDAVRQETKVELFGKLKELALEQGFNYDSKLKQFVVVEEAEAETVDAEEA